MNNKLGEFTDVSVKLNLSLFDEAEIDVLILKYPSLIVITSSSSDAYLLSPKELDKFLLTHIASHSFRLKVEDNCMTTLTIQGQSLIHFLSKVDTFLLSGSMSATHIQFF
uniref:Uncharacterized protein n=1 Tax=Panagrolaimus superbus TaxID=310955 RepID=A0A914YMF8_9BILA